MVGYAKILLSISPIKNASFELLFLADPFYSTVIEFFPKQEVLQFQHDKSADVKKFVVTFIEEAW